MTRSFYFSELVAVRHNLVQMGETTEQLFAEALRAMAEPGAAAASAANELESRTDQQHRQIHDQCLKLITLQAPVARDARLVTGVLDAIVDLELIGDYSREIAALSCAMPRRAPSSIISKVSAVAGKVESVLQAGVGTWRGTPPAQPELRPQETSIRADCADLYERLSQLTSTPGEAPLYVDLMLICRHLERILRHAVCVAEQGAAAAPFDQAAEGA